MRISEEELLSRLVPLKRKLFDARARREPPFVNRIALTAWSGLLIAGLAQAGRALEEPGYISLAGEAADFVLEHQRGKDGRLLRTFGAPPGQPPRAAGDAYLEDYACLVHGLLNLHDATGGRKWLDEARLLTDVMISKYGDDKAGGFYFTANDHEKLFARSKDSFDAAMPSGNSAAARNLVRLWRKTGEERYRATAEKTLRAFAATLKENTSGHCTLAEALDMYVTGK
jgi:uncharacterized protein YyaL (SSP411 family)